MFLIAKAALIKCPSLGPLAPWKASKRAAQQYRNLAILPSYHLASSSNLLDRASLSGFHVGGAVCRQRGKRRQLGPQIGGATCQLPAALNRLREHSARQDKDSPARWLCKRDGANSFRLPRELAFFRQGSAQLSSARLSSVYFTLVWFRFR